MNKKEIEKKLQERFAPGVNRSSFVSDKEKLAALQAVFNGEPEKVKKAIKIIKTQATLLKVLSGIVLVQFIGSFAALIYLVFFK